MTYNTSIKFDYSNNKLLVDGLKYDLESLRQYISNYYGPLKSKYKIKTIRKNSILISHYDWEYIFEHSKKELIILEFTLNKIFQVTSPIKN
jgi:hypothetical protein